MEQDRGLNASHHEAYSIQEFCRFFSVGRSSIYEEIRAGRLRIRKAGTRTLIAREDALAWLNALPASSQREPL